MNVLWKEPMIDLASLPMAPRRTLKNLMLTLNAARGGGVPIYGIGFDIGGELVHWKPTGEVVTIGGMDDGN